MRPPPPFRLLAITPPSGAVDLEVVDRWVAGAATAAVGIAVLLREPGARLAALVDPRGRLGPLAGRCRERGIDLLVSLGADELPSISKAAGAHGLVGAQLRGDPSLAQLTDFAARAPGLIRGRSCHGAPQTGDALVDYTCLAPIFPPQTSQRGVDKIAVGLDPVV
ncbi:MAG: hypothetical protein KC420_12435, partial [Myxococcales bacterium]|nr:hypothetical protein [Myxococcales bacterium]